MRPVEGEAIVAYLNTLEPGERAPKSLVVELRTATPSEAMLSESLDRARLKKRMPQATDAVLNDFIRVLAGRSALQIPRHLVHKNIRLQMSSEAEIARIFKADDGQGWGNFYKAYPEAGGLVRLSRAGLDEKSTQALFFISISGGMTRGAGFFVLMHRRLGMWRILATEQAWIS
ncbi:hypothetical protein D3C71_1247690 [compost metagenome]|jgi:hypothetical protein